MGYPRTSVPEPRKENLIVCPNGIPESLDYEPIAERHNQVPHLLFLSNLIESKGVWVLLDALKILNDKGYSFVCDFVGGETSEIDEAKFNEEVKKRGLGRFVVYNGRKYGVEKISFLTKLIFSYFQHFIPMRLLA